MTPIFPLVAGIITLAISVWLSLRAYQKTEPGRKWQVLTHLDILLCFAAGLYLILHSIGQF